MILRHHFFQTYKFHLTAVLCVLHHHFYHPIPLYRISSLYTRKRSPSGDLFRQAEMPIGVFFTAIFPLEVNEQALCQQPQVGPKSSGFGELPNKHFCGPAASKNFGVWPHPNCLPKRATRNMAQKTEVTLSFTFPPFLSMLSSLGL